MGEAVYIPSVLSDILDGTTHKHHAGDGGAIDHADLSNAGTTSHTDIDSYLHGMKGNVTAGAGVRVIRKDDNIYIRTSWNATSDLLQSFKLAIATPDGRNNALNGVNIGLIPIATQDSAVPTTTITTNLKATDDDMAPVYINGTYLGGNHGAYVGKSITATAHGKTVEDVGSEWVDSDGHKWYIIKRVDANTLWVLSENTSVTSIWSFYSAISGTTLTHSSGALHTPTITFTAQATTQMHPGVNNLVKQVLLDGTTPITQNGVYYGEFVDLEYTYDILDPASMLSYVRSQVGSSTQPALDDPSITKVARVTHTSRYVENGSATTYHTVQYLELVSMSYTMPTQAGNVNPPAGGSTYEYIPKTLPVTVGTPTYDFTVPVLLGSLTTTASFPSTSWADANNPPWRGVQYSTDSSGNKIFGYTVGVDPTRGAGLAATRKVNLASAFDLSAVKKQYIYGASGGSTTYPNKQVPAGTTYHMIGFRCPVNYASYPTATNVSWFYVGRDVYLMIDYHTAFSGWIPLPYKFIGRTTTVIESSGCTVNSTLVGHDGINIAIPGSYGYAVVKLSL